MRTIKVTRSNYAEEILADQSEWTERPKGESLTIPGQTLPLRTLLDRYVMGGNVEVFPPVYLGEEETDIPDDLERMDPFEKLEMARELRQSIADAQLGKQQTVEPVSEPVSEPKQEPKPTTTQPPSPVS